MFGAKLTGLSFMSDNIAVGATVSYSNSNGDYYRNKFTVGVVSRYYYRLNKWMFYGGLALNYEHTPLGMPTDKEYTFDINDSKNINDFYLSPHIGVGYSFNKWGVFLKTYKEFGYALSIDDYYKGIFTYDIGVFFKF